MCYTLNTLSLYLEYEKFVNQSSFRCKVQITNLSGPQMSWRLRLPKFDFNVVYKKGKLNTYADALSLIHFLVSPTLYIDE